LGQSTSSNPFWPARSRPPSISGPKVLPSSTSDPNENNTIVPARCSSNGGAQCHEIKVFTNRAWSLAAYATDDILRNKPNAPEMIVPCFPCAHALCRSRTLGDTQSPGSLSMHLARRRTPPHPVSGDLSDPSMRGMIPPTAYDAVWGPPGRYHDCRSIGVVLGIESGVGQCRRKGCRCIQTRVYTMPLCFLPFSLSTETPVWRLPRSWYNPRTGALFASGTYTARTSPQAELLRHHFSVRAL